MKYRDAMEQPTPRVTGKGHEYQAQYIWEDGNLSVIDGIPACPECKEQLYKVYSEDKFYCFDCGAVWTPEELVSAARSENNLMKGD